MEVPRRSFVLILPILACLALPAKGAVIIGNLPAPNNDFSGQFGPGSGNRKQALSFTMAAGDPVPLGLVRLPLVCMTCPLVMDVTIQGDNGGEPNGTVLAMLTGPATVDGFGIFEFASTVRMDLQPGTTYWLVVDGDTRGNWFANSVGFLPTSEFGVSFGSQLTYYLGSWQLATANPDFVFNFEVTTDVFIFVDGFESDGTGRWSEVVP